MTMKDKTKTLLDQIEHLTQKKSHNTLEKLPEELYIIPTSERPFFPSQTLPIIMNEGNWLETIKKINESEQKMAGILLTTKSKSEQADPDNLYDVGTLIVIHHPVRASKKIQFIAEGKQRFKIKSFISNEAPFLAKVEYPTEPPTDDINQLKIYAMAIIDTLKTLIPLNPLYSEELKFFLKRFEPNDPSPLTDFAASLTRASKTELQEIMDAIDLKARMEKVLLLIKQEVELATVQANIKQQVDEKISDNQRKYLLKEQLKIIQKELGLEKDDKAADRELFEERIENMDLPEKVHKRIDSELSKISILEVGSPEYGQTRNYLDTITQVPWGVYTKDNFDIEHAKKVLNKEHEHLDDIKQRIVELIAVGQLKGSIAGSIILLSGPPGVGKTSIGKSIAKSLNRHFYRFSVGGMSDESEIKGHRRTYIGALPGKITQAFIECQSQNPVILLDEIDKMGKSHQGDPASALLEALDPEQNNEFLDHYLDVRIDLSKILFIATANQTDTIPRPLLDRMELWRLSGYIMQEKLAIAKKHLWPRVLERHGMTKNNIKLNEAAIRRIIIGYARESGVRSLEKYLAQIARQSAVKLIKEPEKVISVNTKNILEYLGPEIFQKERVLKGVGVVTGLAWTSLGGATLSIEAKVVDDIHQKFQLTGQLGDVMQESARIAYSFMQPQASRYEFEPNFFINKNIHLHVPSGSTPKDGPSAGITMATALLSLARNQRIGHKCAMTGELTLTGQVLAVGGIREKIIAARRTGIMEIILPHAVFGDYEDLPDYIKEGLTVHFVEHYDEVFHILFEYD